MLVGLLIGFAKSGMPSSGIFGVAVMAILFPAKESVGLLLPMLVTADIFAVSYYRRKAIWKHLLGLLPWVAAGMAGGYFVLEWSDNRVLQVLIGVTVLALVVLHLLKNQLNSRVEKMIDTSIWFTAIIGLLAGFTTMIGNAAGGIITLYLLSKRLNKTEFVGTGAWLYFMINASKLPLFASLGLITWHTLTYDLWMIPVIVAGGFLGLYVIKIVPEVWYQRILLILTTIGAIRLLWG